MVEMIAAHSKNNPIADIPINKALLFQVLFSVIRLNTLAWSGEWWSSGDRYLLNCESRAIPEWRFFTCRCVGHQPTPFGIAKNSLFSRLRQGLMGLKAGHFEEKDRLICCRSRQPEVFLDADPELTGSLASWAASSSAFVVGALQVKCSQT